MIDAEVAVSDASACRQHPSSGGAVESGRAVGVFVRGGAAS
ncbi:hypothetical protein [Streptomyces sp. NPDC002746]